MEKQLVYFANYIDESKESAERYLFACSLSIVDLNLYLRSVRPELHIYTIGVDVKVPKDNLSAYFVISSKEAV